METSFVLTAPSQSRKGEHDLYVQLRNRAFTQTTFWFSLDFIPGVRDIDLLVWNRINGVFVVEIKAVPIDALMEFSYSHCHIKGRNPSESPQVQAYEASISLRNFLQPRVTQGIPFIVSTVIWPLISRGEWKANFRHNQALSELSESFLMKDEALSSAQVFEHRLSLIRNSPPIRKGPQSKYQFNQKNFDEISRALSPSASPLPPLSDRDKLARLEKTLRSELLRQFPVSGGRKALYTGKPGTGKTFRLFQIGLLHSREGARTLLVCFNKVLASDFKRSINLLSLISSESKSKIKEHFRAEDIFSLLHYFATQFNLDFDEQAPEVWGELVAEEVQKRSRSSAFLKYQTILIDEAQDFARWQIDFMSSLLTPNGTLVLGLGEEQELYQGKESSLNFPGDFTEYTHFQLRRNFRNARPIYQLAHLWYECYPDVGSIAGVFTRTFANRKQSENEIQFDFTEELYPTITYIDDELIDIDDNDFTEKRDRLLVESYSDIFFKAASKLREDRALKDLIVMVPDTESYETHLARAALINLKKDKGIDHIDYVDRAFRASPYPDNSIRFVTFHSARGLDAASVIVIGIDKLARNSDKRKLLVRRLGFITLSRAIFSLQIVQQTSLKNEVCTFLETALTYIQEHGK